MNSISSSLNLMIKACEKASKIIIRDFGEIENLQVSKKGPKDFVTKTDKYVCGRRPSTLKPLKFIREKSLRQG